mgnify:CR=1 FL=1
MKIYSVDKSENTVYVGLIEGKEYKGFIHPSVLGGIDSSVEQEIKVNVTTVYFEVHTIKYYISIAFDEKGNIVYTEIDKL